MGLKAFPGSLVVKTWQFHCCGPGGFSPWWGNAATVWPKKKKKEKCGVKSRITNRREDLWSRRQHQNKYLGKDRKESKS